MVAPILTRLHTEISSTSDPERQGVLTVQVASYLARIGEFDEAERLRLELRRQFGDGHNAEVSIRIMCLEAMQLYYQALDPKARDRLLRANLLAVACKHSGLCAYTFAWLAHIDFNQAKYAEMATWIRRCNESLSSDDGSARCRLSLVLGDANLFAMQDEESRKWYEQARLLATKLGDQAAIGAVTYNSAALKVTNGRIRHLRSPLSKSEVDSLALGVRSAVNYQYVARLSSLDHLLTAATVGVDVLANRYDVAQLAIEGLLANPATSPDSIERASLLADLSLVHAKLGRKDQSKECMSSAAGLANRFGGSEDRAIVFGSLAQAGEALQDQESASEFAKRRDEALSDHQATIDGLAALLAPYRGA